VLSICTYFGSFAGTGMFYHDMQLRSTYQPHLQALTDETVQRFN